MAVCRFCGEGDRPNDPVLVEDVEVAELLHVELEAHLSCLLDRERSYRWTRRVERACVASRHALRSHP